MTPCCVSTIKCFQEWHKLLFLANAKDICLPITTKTILSSCSALLSEGTSVTDQQNLIMSRFNPTDHRVYRGGVLKFKFCCRQGSSWRYSGLKHLARAKWQALKGQWQIMLSSLFFTRCWNPFCKKPRKAFLHQPFFYFLSFI